MNSTQFVETAYSLGDLCGNDYVKAVCEARAFFTGEDVETLRALAREPVDFYPRAFQERQIALLNQVGASLPGHKVLESAKGASTRAFDSATKQDMAPLSALGWYRCGEDGRLYLTTKSEHYHASLGHGFPGYALLDRARRLGIPNATHNNTRGHVTRLLEEELVSAANGLERGDAAGLRQLIENGPPDALNRVLNLETGSLAVEAALKMILARFYRMQPGQPAPLYAGRIPVLLVMGDDAGGLDANYHGTTVLTQILRGMWPELRSHLEKAGLYEVCAIRSNNLSDLDDAFQTLDTGTRKIAGFFHEIVMMNYGGTLLYPEYLRRAYALCRKHDVPTVADEIQSCAWAPDLFLFREFGLKPTFVALGKGFPGGEYPASRILFNASMDNGMPQFGALVTNGQEEIASLAYLVTMRWVQANGQVVRRVGEDYASRMCDLAAQFPEIIERTEGWGHLSTLVLHDLAVAKDVAARLVKMGLDISVQSYKSDCPPALLTKLPLTAGHEVVAFVAEKLESVLHDMTQEASGGEAAHGKT